MRSDNVFDRFDFRQMLYEEFRQRQVKNESYSLRAFARASGVSVTYLSQLFANKRGLSAATGAKIVKNLGWPPPRRREFLKLLHVNSLPEGESRRDLSREIQESSAPDFADLERDQFQMIAEWQHYAIVELVGLRDFKPTVTAIARRLGLSRKVAAESIDRLIRVGLLARSSEGLKKTHTFYRMPSMPSAALRSFHYGHIKRALKALDNRERDLRDITGTTLALDMKKLPEIKQLIAEFRNRLNQFCASHQDANAVYQLSVQLFRLDQEIK